MQLPAALLDFLPRVRSVGAITGAGVSAESGIQTYRGQGGVYDDPEVGDQTVEALSGETLAIDPDRTWRTIAGMARQSRDARPTRCGQEQGYTVAVMTCPMGTVFLPGLPSRQRAQERTRCVDPASDHLVITFSAVHF